MLTYFTGCAIVLLIGIIFCVKKLEQLTLSDLLIIMLISLGSWIIVVSIGAAVVIHLIAESPNIYIYKKKSNEQFNSSDCRD